MITISSSWSSTIVAACLCFWEFQEHYTHLCVFFFSWWWKGSFDTRCCPPRLCLGATKWQLWLDLFHRRVTIKVRTLQVTREGLVVPAFSIAQCPVFPNATNLGPRYINQIITWNLWPGGVIEHTLVFHGWRGSTGFKSRTGHLLHFYSSTIS